MPTARPKWRRPARQAYSEVYTELPTLAGLLRRKAAGWRKSIKSAARRHAIRANRGEAVSNDRAAEKLLVAQALERAAELLDQAQDKMELLKGGDAR